MFNRDDAPSRGRRRGPWFLRLDGIWGTGRRSFCRVDHVQVEDLGAPPQEEESQEEDAAGEPATAAHAMTFVDEIREDCAPSTSGLEMEIGSQTLSHKSGTGEITG